jgi:hypothetical protein
MQLPPARRHLDQQAPIPQEVVHLAVGIAAGIGPKLPRSGKKRRPTCSMPSMAIRAPFPLRLRQWLPLLARLDRVFREAMEAKNHGAALGVPQCPGQAGECAVVVGKP